MSDKQFFTGGGGANLNSFSNNLSKNLDSENPAQDCENAQFLQDLLKDEIFYTRYIERNATNYMDAFFTRYIPVNIFARAFKKCLKILSDKVPYLRPKFEKRLLSGKIDIPYIEVVLTTKCTLNCQSCNNMMQYFNPHQQYSGTLEKIKQDLTRLLDSVDSISWLRLIGGEPLLFKDLAKLVEFLDSQKKIRVINIVTNATIKFSDELLDALAKSKKTYTTISDYSCSPNLRVKLQIEKIVSDFKRRKIKYIVIWNSIYTKWFDPGKVYKRGRDKAGIVKNFRACLMPCVSFLDGKVFVCPIASSLSRLNGEDEFQGDFVRLDSENIAQNRMQILKFYKQDFFKACDYCHDMWESKTYITPAVQLDGVLNVQKD